MWCANHNTSKLAGCSSPLSAHKWKRGHQEVGRLAFNVRQHQGIYIWQKLELWYWFIIHKVLDFAQIDHYTVHKVEGEGTIIFCLLFFFLLLLLLLFLLSSRLFVTFQALGICSHLLNFSYPSSFFSFLADYSLFFPWFVWFNLPINIKGKPVKLKW